METNERRAEQTEKSEKFYFDAVKKNSYFKLNGIFNALGLSSSLCGTNYLREAIVISICERQVGLPLMKTVYKKVAENFGTTPEKVEKSIRNAVNSSLNRCRKENIDFVFGRTIFTDKIKPTSGELIALITDKILYGN